jgi:guanylate kinase
LIKESLESLPELVYSVSATTRPPREGEVEGRDYIFLSREVFERWISEGKFLEFAEYSGNLYGTPEYPVEESLERGLSVILEIELQGAREVRERRPDAVMIFVRAPSLDETRRRLEDRATETSEAMQSRMETAAREVSASEEFDLELINGDRDAARQSMLELMQSIMEAPKSPGSSRSAKGESSAERA